METMPVVIVGLGPIGRLCAEIALDRPDIRIAGAADINPELSGRDLADILGRGPNGITVRDRIDKALDDAGEGVALDQIAQGFRGGRAVITLNLKAYFGHPDPKERIRVKGEPDLELLVPGGVTGDTATCAITINAIPRVLTAKPGPAHHARRGASGRTHRCYLSRQRSLPKGCQPLRTNHLTGRRSDTGSGYRSRYPTRNTN